MTFYPWINLSLASAASLGLLVLFLPPFNIPWFFFFILLPFQIAYLRYPKQGKWFVFPISIFLIYYLKIYTFPFYDFLIVTAALVVFTFISFFSKRFLENNVTFFYPFCGVFFWVFADIIRSHVYGNLFSPVSLLSSYPWLIRTARIFGPQFFILLSVLFQKQTAFALVLKKRLNFLFLSVLIIFIALNSLSGFMIKREYSSKENLITLTIPDNFNFPLDSFLIKINSLLNELPDGIQDNSFFLLPFLPYDMNEDNEKSITRVLGRIAQEHNVFIVFPCFDSFFHHNSIFLFNPKGKLLEVGEQKKKFITNQDIVKGDYSLILDQQGEFVIFLLNEEIFFDASIKSFNRLGGGLILHSSQEDSPGSYYWLNALKLTALLNECSIVSNISGGGLTGIDPNGNLLIDKKKGHYFWNTFQIPKGFGFTPYQRWGNIFGWGSFLLIIIPLLIFFVQKREK